MLSDQVFNPAIKLLQESFPRDKEKLSSQSVLALWRSYFSEELTEQEFLTAVRYVCLNFDFLPAPARFVEYIHGGNEAKALQEWQMVLKASARGDQEQLAYLSDRGRVALQAIGGLHAVGAAEDFQRQRMEKSFVTVFCQCSTKDRKTLAQASVEAPVEVAKGGDEPAPMPEHLKAQMEALKTKFAMSNGSK